MSVLSYLDGRASNAVLSTNETESIARSVGALSTRLNNFFSNSIANDFRFGSSTRGTILPRRMDEHSDIDYMVVFAESGFTPQTYLDRLRKFVNAYYSSSEIYQSSPTIVLELNHIKFELVPALTRWPSGYNIPNGTSDWQPTNPNDFNDSLTKKNNSEKSLIKPTIRLAKYWNAKNDYVFDSYGFEKWIVDRLFYGCTNLKEYLFTTFDGLSTNIDTQWRKDRVQRAKDIIAKVRQYERDQMPVNAEAEVKKLIPE